MTKPTTPSANVLRISDIISKEINIDSETKDFVSKDSDEIFDKTIPEHLTKKQILDVRSNDKDFVAGGLHAFSNMSLDNMLKHKSVNKNELTLKMGGKDEVSFISNRSQAFYNPKDPENNVVKLFTTKIKYTTEPTIDTGDLSLIKKQFTDLAMEANLAPIKDKE